MKSTLIFICTILLSLVAPLVSQVANQATVSGTIMLGQVAFPTVSVSLLQDSATKPLSSTITNPDGTFSFSAVPFGAYKIRVSPDGKPAKLYAVTVDKPYIAIDPIVIPQ